MNQCTMNSEVVVTKSMKFVMVVALTMFFTVAAFATISFISSRSHARVVSSEAGI